MSLETSLEIGIKNKSYYDAGLYDWPGSTGSYMQFSGMTVWYDSTKEAGERIYKVMIGDKALESDVLYKVAVNSYSASDANFPQLADAKTVNEYGASEEIVSNYITVIGVESAFNVNNLIDEPQALESEDSIEDSLQQSSEPVLEASDESVSFGTGEKNYYMFFALAGGFALGVLTVLCIEKIKK